MHHSAVPRRAVCTYTQTPHLLRAHAAPATAKTALSPEVLATLKQAQVGRLLCRSMHAELRFRCANSSAPVLPFTHRRQWRLMWTALCEWARCTIDGPAPSCSILDHQAFVMR